MKIPPYHSFGRENQTYPSAQGHCELNWVFILGWNISKLFSCHECGKSYSNKKALQNHNNSHKGLTFCDICNKNFSTVSNLRAHMNSLHFETTWTRKLSTWLLMWISDCENQETWNTEWTNKQFSCDICLKEFSNKKSLHDHSNIHKGRTKCQVCEKVFSTTSNMRIHMRNTHGAIGTSN